ncbi:hypothetical protein GCM10011375_11550 [Hymenobacter qilianensis]|uniref:Uncharacterized protein n=2 Tax=Hymenobacter qilianensis TaxID=1385715 RepID=A0ACB5PP58_9BACT|nr:hypothetical protein [Hymenobacter qilianensis]QNP53277.1 hypothetical protein H9L05_06525 [Hymenobacter qilianensis]GGF58102.1 hypothetical protein GCM10011375_11550 [Hymenobacter qilianensis]
MLSLDLDFLRLSYRPDLQLLFLRWTRPVSTAEHQHGYTAALHLARSASAGRWLIDLRSRGLASAEEFSWVLTEFRSRMGAALPHVPRRIAYLVTPYHSELIRERLALLEPTFPLALQQGAVIQVFTEEHPAQQWLHMGGV